MTDFAVGYADPDAESRLLLAPSGSPLILVSTLADVDIELENQFDQQRKHGQNLGRPKFIGIKPAEFGIDFIVYPEDETVFWRDVVPMLRQKGKAGNSPPMDIVNLQVNRCGINTITLLKAKIKAPNAKDGRHVALVCREWSSGPTAPGPDTSAKKAVTPGVLAGGAAKKHA